MITTTTLLYEATRRVMTVMVAPALQSEGTGKMTVMVAAALQSEGTG